MPDNLLVNGEALQLNALKGDMLNDLGHTIKGNTFATQNILKCPYQIFDILQRVITFTFYFKLFLKVPIKLGRILRLEVLKMWQVTQLYYSNLHLKS